MRTIYISGPITGTTDYEERFNKAADALRKMDMRPVNPVEIGKMVQRRFPDREITFEEYMTEDLKALITCDGIMMLPGWKDSKGAVVEHYVAKACGKTFVKIKELADRWRRD